MNETNFVASNSDGELFQLLLDGYLRECGRFARIAQSQIFDELISSFDQYEHFVKVQGRQATKRKLIASLADKTGTVDISTHSLEYERILSCAQLAACAHLFTGWSLRGEDLGIKEMEQIACKFVENVRKAGRSAVDRAIDKLNHADAIRVIQTLKLAGLIKPNISVRRQLSLGAGNGARDLHSIHLVPVIRVTESIQNPIHMRRKRVLDFHIKSSEPNDVILIDGDDYLKKQYDWFNNKSHGKILAINDYAHEALQEVAKLVNNGKKEPRDFVIAMRMDPRMLDDVEQFQADIGTVIDDVADLIITIGAGHTDHEFMRRMDKMSEIFSSLKRKNMNPIRLRWNRGNSVSERRQNPALGAPSCASYEIICCRLLKKNLC